MVAGVPSLADYDVIIDAGGDASDPETAVPFSIKTEDGRTFKQPGNLFFLVESSLYGTEPKFSAKADLDGDGKVAFGEALPDPRFYLAALEGVREAGRPSSTPPRRSGRPNEQDALTALVVMTPTMSEYFEAWKNSRFVAGDKATEKSFVGASRLQDIADILGGLELIYANVETKIAEANPEQAKQTGQSLSKLEDFAARLRDQEAAGKKFTAEDADTLGREAQDRAEAIAGQITQAAKQLNIELETLDAGEGRLGRRPAPPRRCSRRRRARAADAGDDPMGRRRARARGAVRRPGGPDPRHARRGAGATSGARAPPTAARCARACAPTAPAAGPAMRRALAAAARAARARDERALASARGAARAAALGGAYAVTLDTRRPRRRRRRPHLAAAARLPHRHALHAPGRRRDRRRRPARQGQAGAERRPPRDRQGPARRLPGAAARAAQGRRRRRARRASARGAAETAAQAAGYWQILAPRYRQDRGAAGDAAPPRARSPTCGRAPRERRPPGRRHRARARSTPRSTASPPRPSPPRSRPAAPSSCCASSRSCRSSTAAASRTGA